MSQPDWLTQDTRRRQAIHHHLQWINIRNFTPSNIRLIMEHFNPVCREKKKKKANTNCQHVPDSAWSQSHVLNPHEKGVEAAKTFTKKYEMMIAFQIHKRAHSTIKLLVATQIEAGKDASSFKKSNFSWQVRATKWSASDNGVSKVNRMCF